MKNCHSLKGGANSLESGGGGGGAKSFEPAIFPFCRHPSP